MCISFFVCFFLECLWSLFSKVCLSYLYGSFVSFFSVSHFLFCSWEWSVPCLCSPRPGSSFPLCLCVTSGCFVLISCPAYLSFFLFVNWLFVTLSPCSFDILPFSDSTVSTLSWLSLFHMSFLPLLGHLLSFFMLCVLLLCLFVFCDFPFHQSSLFSFLLCFPPSTDFCVFQPLHESMSPPPWCPVLFSPCIFFVHVCVCSCVHVCDKGASKPFIIGAECQLSK